MSYRWLPVTIKGGQTWKAIREATELPLKVGSHVVLYYTPERGWWGYSSPPDQMPDNAAQVRLVMDTEGKLRPVNAATILRAAEAIAEGFPNET